MTLLEQITRKLEEVPLSISSTRRAGTNGLRNADEVAAALTPIIEQAGGRTRNPADKMSGDRVEAIAKAIREAHAPDSDGKVPHWRYFVPDARAALHADDEFQASRSSPPSPEPKEGVTGKIMISADSIGKSVSNGLDGVRYWLCRALTDNPQFLPFCVNSALVMLDRYEAHLQG